MARYCTIPKILGFRKWFEKRFQECCQEHDVDYVEQEISRYDADRKMYNCMKAKGYKVFGAITYYGFLRPLGWLWWKDIIGDDD